ncbi:MAG: hypothetical protein QM754_09010 [Tepidisphaeraceae bacterium]
MLNEVRLLPPEPNNHAQPPVEVVATTDAAHQPRNPAVKPHSHIQPHVDDRLPGRHKPRVMGEPATTDTVYAMPMEDRGSTFSLGLSAVVVAMVFVVLMVVWASVYR